MAALAAAWLLAPAPGLSATLEAHVLGHDGAPLADALVQLSSRDAGIHLHARTDAAGLHVFRGLPGAIDYVLRVEDGTDAHATTVQDRIALKAGEVGRESFRLFPSILELVRVRAAREGRLVELTEVGTRTRYSDEFLAGLPVTCSP